MTISLRPSGSYRWTRCAAAPTFESRVPAEPPSDEAREGTCAAWLAEQVLRGVTAFAADYVGRSHENGWLVTADMAEYVQNYVDMIKARGGITTAEQFVRLTHCIAGTLDASTSLDNGTLHVDDLKYGMKIVEVFDNTQCIIYGAAETLRLGGGVERVTLGIYQPRAFHPDGIYRTWTMTVEELFQRATWIAERGEACQQPNPAATPGKHCDHCNARTSCVALTHSVYADYSVIEDVRQRHMTADELARELTFLDEAERRLKARKSAVMAEGEQRIRKGEYVRNWHIEAGKGNRKFTVDAGTVRFLTGVDPVVPSMVTPAELERKGASPALVACITERPATGFKLVRMPTNHIEKTFSVTSQPERK